jgi:hypothetical protein
LSACRSARYPPGHRGLSAPIVGVFWTAESEVGDDAIVDDAGRLRRIAGFTVFDGDGQWRNPQTGGIAGNRTKILLVAARRTPDLAQRLSAVIDAYKARFHHQSVGIITRDSCAAF